ncbi:MAG TPA: amidase, partial [Alcanivorax sp.]|nr:amidase [Alcanivorax sp.]
MNQYAGPAPEARLHAFRDDALGDHDATALADLLRRGERSAAQLTDAAIERIQAVNPALNGLALDTFETARRSADQRLRDGG